MKTPCPKSAHVLRAIHIFLSEENSLSSSSPLPTLSPELKAHLATCASCASDARALDPTLLFVPLAASVAAPPAAEDVRRVTDEVLAEVRRRSRIVAPPARSRFFSRRFLQAAALVVLAAGLFGIGGLRLAQKAQEPVALAPTPDGSQDLSDTREVVDVRPGVRPLIQDLRNPGARIYEFAAVSPKEPSVVFIADPHVDL